MTLQQTESENRSVHRTGFTDVNEALSWLVRKLDADFKHHDMVSMTIEQYLIVSDDQDNGQKGWSAHISGDREGPACA